MTDDLERRLEEAGRRPVPAPDPAFADALEARLLAIASTAPPPPEPRRRGHFGRLLTALGALGLAAAALVLALGTGANRPVIGPELARPVNVEVVLTDGTVLEDPDGLRLPDGAVLRVGTGGSARVGEVLLESGDVATVEQGRLQVEHDQPVGALPGGTGAGSGRPRATRSPTPAAATASPPARTATPTGRPTTPPTPAPTRPAAATPAPTRPPATPEPARTDRPPAPTSAPTPSPSDVIVRPRLRARLVAPSRIRVTWTATPGAAGYVLVASGSREGPAPGPRYPGGQIMGEFAHPPDVALRFRVPNGIVEIRLRVVALAPDGSVLARSRIVTIPIGG